VIVHVQQQGAELRVSRNLLIVHLPEGDRVVAHVPLVEAIVLHGGVHLSAAAVGRLLREGIDCVFLTRSGRYKGRLEARPSTAARRRALQAAGTASAAFRLAAARAIVRNKVRSQARVGRALLKERGLRLAAELGELAASLPSYSRLVEVQGLEGYASRRYFAALKEVLSADHARWTRGNRPAEDGLNALLNYGYAILESKVEASVLSVGLDPFLGFLHQLGRPRPAFVLDMMEEFRPLIVDFSCWRLLPRLGPEPEWFSRHGDRRLSEDSRRALIQALERRLASLTFHAPSRSRVSLRRTIDLQVLQFAAALENRSRTLRPVR
jgi:CRISPR-associated protein Cas1